MFDYLNKDEHLAPLKPYIAGKSTKEIAEKYNLDPVSIIKLASNENPRLSPLVLEKFKEILLQKNDDYLLNIYGDALGERLISAIKNNFPEIGNAEIVIGNGMDNILESIARLILRKGDQSLITVPSFSYYEMISRWAQAEPIFIPTYNDKEQNFSLNISDILEKFNSKVKIIFLCNPNNPTGAYINIKEIETLAKEALKKEIFLFIDEAYIDYSEEDSFISKVQNYKNVIVGKTFSKAYGLAGQRIGYAIIHQNLLNLYSKVQTPFAVNKLGLIFAETVLKDKAFLRETIEINKQGREYIFNALKDFNFKVFKSYANYISFFVNDLFKDAEDFFIALLKRGIIVRNVSSKFSNSNHIRVSIGTMEQNRKFIKALEQEIKERSINK